MKEILEEKIASLQDLKNNIDSASNPELMLTVINEIAAAKVELRKKIS